MTPDAVTDGYDLAKRIVLVAMNPDLGDNRPGMVMSILAREIFGDTTTSDEDKVKKLCAALGGVAGALRGSADAVMAVVGPSGESHMYEALTTVLMSTEPEETA